MDGEPGCSESRIERIFPLSNPDAGLWFSVMIRMTSSELSVRGAIEVGTLRLRSGGMVEVVVRPGPLSPGSVAKVADLRPQMLAAVTGVRARRDIAFAWGSLADGATSSSTPSSIDRRTPLA